MAMSPQDREERRKAKSARLMEYDLRLKLHLDNVEQLKELMSWASIEESGEALTLLIYNARRLGRDRFHWFMGGAQLQIEDAGLAKSNRREARMRARPGTLSELDEMGAWLGPTDRSLTVRMLIEKTHALGSFQAFALLKLPPRHTYEISSSVARKLEMFCARRALRAPALPSDEDPDDTGLLLLGNG